MYGMLPCSGGSALAGKADGKKEGVGDEKGWRNVRGCIKISTCRGWLCLGVHLAGAQTTHSEKAAISVTTKNSKGKLTTLGCTEASPIIFSLATAMLVAWPAIPCCKILTATFVPFHRPTNTQCTWVLHGRLLT